MIWGNVLQHESTLRMFAFGSVLLVCMFAEWRWPRRGDHGAQGRRLRNYSLVLIDSLVLRLLFPLLAVEFAVLGQSLHWGLGPALGLPFWMQFVLSLLLLDLGIYAQHRLMHVLPWLWRLHRVHHSDAAFDVSLGVRFHPLEIVLSMLWKLLLGALLGIPALAMLFYEVLLSAASLFTHTDVSLPPRFESWLRRAVITPDLHRVHHSVHRDETDSNFGSLLVIWDRCFRTFNTQPRDGHLAMRIGLTDIDASKNRSLIDLLLLPFRKQS